MTDHKAFIITAHFEDFADRFLVLKQGDRVLATIAEPTGPGGNRSFGVWTGNGLDSNGEERIPDVEYITRTFDGDVEKCWQAAVRTGYELAAEEL
jgi:hypothetical protein